MDNYRRSLMMWDQLIFSGIEITPNIINSRTVTILGTFSDPTTNALLLILPIPVNIKKGKLHLLPNNGEEQIYNIENNTETTIGGNILMESGSIPVLTLPIPSNNESGTCWFSDFELEINWWLDEALSKQYHDLLQMFNIIDINSKLIIDSYITSNYELDPNTAPGSISIYPTMDENFFSIYANMSILDSNGYTGSTRLNSSESVTNPMIHLLPDGGEEISFYLGSYDHPLIEENVPTKIRIDFTDREDGETGLMWFSGFGCDKYVITEYPKVRYEIPSRGTIRAYPSIDPNRQLYFTIELIDSVGYSGNATFVPYSRNWNVYALKDGDEHAWSGMCCIDQLIYEGTSFDIPNKLYPTGNGYDVIPFPDKPEGETGEFWLDGLFCEEYHIVEYPHVRYNLPERGEIRIYPSYEDLENGYVQIYINMEILRSAGYTGSTDSSYLYPTLWISPKSGSLTFRNLSNIIGLSEDTPKSVIKLAKSDLGTSGALYFSSFTSNDYYVSEFTRITYQFPNEQ